MFKETLSQTLNSEIKKLYPYNKTLLSYKKWSDSFNEPLRNISHRLLKRTMEWWYEKDINLHNLPLEKQIENVKKKSGGKENPKIDTSDYIWSGQGDWHR